MKTLVINELQARLELPLSEAKECLLKNSRCKSIIRGDKATLIYPLNEIQTITSILNYDRHPKK